MKAAPMVEVTTFHSFTGLISLNHPHDTHFSSNNRIAPKIKIINSFFLSTVTTTSTFNLIIFSSVLSMIVFFLFSFVFLTKSLRIRGPFDLDFICWLCAARKSLFAAFQKLYYLMAFGSNGEFH